jgi:PPM family protein phosphatase
MIGDSTRMVSCNLPVEGPLTPARLTPRHAGLSDAGRVRTNNEDRWFADPEQQLYLVADGIGGHLAGELASRLIVEVLPGQLRRAVGDTPDFADKAVVRRVIEAVATLSRNMRKESLGQPGLSGMGATLVLTLLRGGQALVVHMGDSRAYLCRGSGMQRLTRDHTVVQVLLDGGVITPDEAASHPARNQLTRFVGMTGEPLPDVRLVDLLPGDRLLLCTDGLSGLLADQQLQALLAQHSDPARACRRLIEAANAAGGNDNVTALVVAL